MIPQNESVLQLQASARELTWVGRMQSKLESFCEAEAVRNPNQLVQETSAYLEKQMTTAGTNMRKFCAEFMKELLLPDRADEVEVPQGDTLSRESNGLQTVTKKATKMAKPPKLLDTPTFDPEGSISGSSVEDANADQISAGTFRQAERAIQQTVPLMEATNPSIPGNPSCAPTAVHQSVQRGLPEGDADQYAHWFVNEEYWKYKLGKSTYTSSLQSGESLQREASIDSLLDWELI